MDQPVIFTIPQLNQDGIRKTQEISEAFTDCLRTVRTVIGDTPEVHLVAMKLEEAWLYANKALATTARNRVAA
jgi:hypothetical protein